MLRGLGHDCTVHPCGLLVNPEAPWLGASPDGSIYDPAEVNSRGILEIKCPYSLRDKSLHDLHAAEFCSDITENGPVLKRDHIYYCQVLGQMAISQVTWADFVVYSKQFILIERIRFSNEDWKKMKMRLDNFYFSDFLPFLETTAATLNKI